MGLEEDFLKNDIDDEKTIEYIKNYLPQELKEKFSDDEFYYFLDLIDEYYTTSGVVLIYQIQEVVELVVREFLFQFLRQIILDILDGLFIVDIIFQKIFFQSHTQKYYKSDSILLA